MSTPDGRSDQHSNIGELLHGMSSHLMAIGIIVKRPSLLLSCAPGSLIIVISALVTAGTIWVLCLLLRFPPFQYVVPFETVLRHVSVVSLHLVTTIGSWSGASGRTFFAAYGHVAPTEAACLRKRRVKHGLLAQLVDVARGLMVGLGVVGLSAASAPLWLPSFLAACAALSATFLLNPFALVGLVIVLPCAAILMRTLAPALSLFLKLRDLSKGLAALVALGATLGLLSSDGVALAVELASAHLVASLHARQLLAQYAIRVPRATWACWCTKTHWALVGLGLPIALLFRATSLHPLMMIGLLDVAHVPAACLLHAKKGRDDLAPE